MVDSRRPPPIVGDSDGAWEARGHAALPSARVVCIQGGSKWRASCNRLLVTFDVELSGRLPQTLIGLMCDRFGDIAPKEQRKTTTLHVSVPDQAALRALLCLIWDNGGTVLSVTPHSSR
jgi:hypothetical protein